LRSRFGIATYGKVLINRVLYSLSAGVSHSSQFALADIYKQAVEGKYNILAEVREYEKRAVSMKKMFLENGFSMVYETDIDEPIADGFYFTLSYRNMRGGELLKSLLYFGISAISLHISGSVMEGVRACVSQTGEDRFEELKLRLEAFNRVYG